MKKDLAECKLVSFPIGIYKVLRNVSGQIHLITLANNELKSLTSKFMTTFSQLRELRLEGNFLHRLPSEVSALQHLKAIDLSRNQFQDFPEQLTALPALETINLEENEIVGGLGCSSPAPELERGGIWRQPLFPCWSLPASIFYFSLIHPSDLSGFSTRRPAGEPGHSLHPQAGGRCARGEAGCHASLAQHQPLLQPTQR
ncbi:leucine-rich repeat-containing protein 20 isoform X2 [Papio anubis]|uniref:leucine-rich repeat-containing protein 20 isoform X2 n=1 Tax=Papio anubis TaxID=9555 RepID=UPI0012AD3D60|nr:leucine-rich repeat-containing protein 20 isoform X2 [Papio anubis]